MASPGSEKQTFFAVYDYGMGGVWVLIDARSPEEIEKLYPELEVATERPEWMTESDMAALDEESMHFDIDESPKGWLEILVKQRRRDHEKKEVPDKAAGQRGFSPRKLGWMPGFAVIFFLHSLMFFIGLKKLLLGVPLGEAMALPMLVVSCFWIVFALLRLMIDIDTLIRFIGLAGILGTVLLLLVRVVFRIIALIT